MERESTRRLLAAFVHAACEAGTRAPVADVEAAGMDLLRRWSKPARGYHDRTHLAEVLDRLTEIGETSAATRLAAWFHDAVYAGRPGQDERESADLARRELRALGAGEATAERVAALVLLTATHRPGAGDAEAAALCDADLAVLAADEQRYAAYVTGVRRDYAHVGDDDFRVGRVAVLADLLARDDLFHTDHGRRHWGSAARANLLRELEDLRDG